MNRFAFLFSLFLLLFPVSAFAGCPPIEGESPDEAMVGSFVKLATKMGVGCPISYQTNSENHSITIEYISPSEKTDTWTRMMTATLIETGNKRSAAMTLALTRNFTKTIASAGGNAQIIAQTERKAGRNAQGIWYAVKYEAGDERSIAVIRTIDERLAAVVQFQQKKTPLTEETIENFLTSNGMASGVLR